MDHNEARSYTRRGTWLSIAVSCVWVGLLLSVVAYAVIEGEAAMAELDSLSLVATYSLSP